MICDVLCTADTVNMAARLAWKAFKLDELILMTHDFQAQLLRSENLTGARIKFAGTVMVKGKDQEHTVYAPIVVKDSLVLAETPSFTILFGRENEIKQIEKFLLQRFSSDNKLLAGAPQLLVIEGMVGLGKSSIINHIVREILPSLQGSIVPRCCHLQASSSSVPFGVCHQILQETLEKAGEADAAVFSRLEVGPLCISAPSDRSFWMFSPVLASTMRPFSCVCVCVCDLVPMHCCDTG